MRLPIFTLLRHGGCFQIANTLLFLFLLLAPHEGLMSLHYSFFRLTINYLFITFGLVLYFIIYMLWLYFRIGRDYLFSKYISIIAGIAIMPLTTILGYFVLKFNVTIGGQWLLCRTILSVLILLLPPIIVAEAIIYIYKKVRAV